MRALPLPRSRSRNGKKEREPVLAKDRERRSIDISAGRSERTRSIDPVSPGARRPRPVFDRAALRD